MNTKKLTEICRPKQWKTIPGNNLLQEGYPVFGANGVIGYWSEYNHESETITIACRGTCGAVRIADAKSYINGNAMCLDDLSNSVLLKYLYYYLRWYDFSEIITGTTIPQITIEGLRKVIVPIPSISGQQAIINILEKVDTVIQGRVKELAALDNMIKARFVEMFGDPVVNEMGWTEISLLESLGPGRTVSYGIVQTGDDFEGGVPVFRPIDIAGGHIPKRDELKKTDPQISAQYKRTLLKGNELLITVRGSVGETFQVTDEFEGCNVGRNIVPLVTDPKKINQRFLQELFDQAAIKRWLKKITKVIALQGLNMSEFKEMPVIMPPMEKQMQYVRFAEQIDRSKSVIQKSLDETQLLFDSLMQKYFG